MIVTTCSLCWLDDYVKNWFIRWIRRYKCKICGNNFLEDRKKRLSNREKLDILERYLKWETITSITKSYKWYTIPWIWKWINFFKKKIKSFEKLKEEIGKTSHYFNIVEINRYKTYIEKNSFDYWYCILDGKYWLIISPSRITNSQLKETMKPNTIESYDEFCFQYRGIFKN